MREGRALTAAENAEAQSFPNGVSEFPVPHHSATPRQENWALCFAERRSAELKEKVLGNSKLASWSHLLPW